MLTQTSDDGARTEGRSDLNPLRLNELIQDAGGFIALPVGAERWDVLLPRLCDRRRAQVDDIDVARIHQPKPHRVALVVLLPLQKIDVFARTLLALVSPTDAFSRRDR